MRNPFTSKSLSETMRRRVELAVAVAQERLLNTHIDHALRLIQLVGEQVPFEDALGIYVRLLRLSNEEARIITSRALAALGEQSARITPRPTLVPEDAEDHGQETPASERRSLINAMRQRLRRRVNHELRRWVELSAARTEVALLDAHVQNALSFCESLRPELPDTEAVELYLDALDVRDAVAEMAYYLALARLAEQELPRRPSRLNGGPSAAPTGRSGLTSPAAEG